MSLPAALCADYTEAAYGLRVYVRAQGGLPIYPKPGLA